MVSCDGLLNFVVLSVEKSSFNHEMDFYVHIVCETVNINFAHKLKNHAIQSFDRL